VEAVCLQHPTPAFVPTQAAKTHDSISSNVTNVTTKLSANGSHCASLPTAPPPWKAVWCEQHSKIYYWNTASGATQWQHPSEKVPLDITIAERLLEMGREGDWDRLFPELEKAERGRQDKHIMRYVDFIPTPRRYGLLHYAAEQGNAQAVRLLIDRFAAHPGLRTPEGLTALDVAWAAGIETALGELQVALGAQPASCREPVAAPRTDCGKHFSTASCTPAPHVKKRSPQDTPMSGDACDHRGSAS